MSVLCERLLLLGICLCVHTLGPFWSSPLKLKINMVAMDNSSFWLAKTLYKCIIFSASPKDCYLVQMWGPLQKFFISSRSDKMHGCYRQFLFLIGWKTLKIFSFKVQMSWHIFGEEIKLTLKKCYQNSNSYPLLTYEKYSSLHTISLCDHTLKTLIKSKLSQWDHFDFFITYLVCPHYALVAVVIVW